MAHTTETFSITSTINLERGDFSFLSTPNFQARLKTVKELVLGKRYDLSLAVVGPHRARSINQATRTKDYVPNVLSFPLAADSGEIILCPIVIKKEALTAKIPTTQHVGFMFIHGLLHLKGLEHGQKMEKEEKRLVKKFFEA